MALISKNDLLPIFRELYSIIGIDNLEKRAIAVESIKQIAIEYRLDNSDAFITCMKKDTTFHQLVINTVTVNETYFMRELKSLMILIDYIEKSKHSVRILSMPCSNGAEVYSILILLHKRDPLLLSKVKIVGVDINDIALSLAKDAIYSQRALHDMDEKDINTYFTLSNKTYHVDTMFKSNVEFINENIFNLSSSKQGEFDVVLSRNLFIYFDKKTRKRAVDRLLEVLKKDGLLVMGHADFIEPEPALEKVGIGIYTKTV